MPPKTKPTHPTISDVALALAQRPATKPVSKVSLNRNARGDVQIDVEVSDHDPQVAADKARVLFAVLDAEYPRDTNGGAS